MLIKGTRNVRSRSIAPRLCDTPLVHLYMTLIMSIRVEILRDFLYSFHPQNVNIRNMTKRMRNDAIVERRE